MLLANYFLNNSKSELARGFPYRNDIRELKFVTLAIFFHANFFITCSTTIHILSLPTTLKAMVDLNGSFADDVGMLVAIIRLMSSHAKSRLLTPAVRAIIQKELW